MEGRGFRDKAAAFAARNAVILGASFDTVAANRAFAEKFGFPFRLLCDTDRALGMAYGACDRPTDGSARRISYVIDAEGTIAHAWEKVKTAVHPDEVLARL